MSENRMKEALAETNGQSEEQKIQAAATTLDAAGKARIQYVRTQIGKLLDEYGLRLVCVHTEVNGVRQNVEIQLVPR